MLYSSLNTLEVRNYLFIFQRLYEKLNADKLSFIFLMSIFHFIILHRLQERSNEVSFFSDVIKPSKRFVRW